MSSSVSDIIRNSLPSRRKQISSGWESFNCGCCVAMGEARPDIKGRGGIIFTPNGGFSYHCFNCKIKVHWEPGTVFGKKHVLLAKSLGLSLEQIRTLKFKAWQMRGQLELNIEVDHKPNWTKISFDPCILPDCAKTFDEWAEMSSPPRGFLNAVEYLNKRSECFLKMHTYYWTPSIRNNMNRRVIVPFYWKDAVVGYTGRLISGVPTKQMPRYYGQVPENFLFNNKVLYMQDRKYVIVVEGVFDAIAIDGLGLLGSSVTEVQLDWIASAKMTTIFVPDRDKASDAMIEVAINQKWEVAFPDWDEGIEDVASAVKYYGQLYTLKSILDARQSAKLAINVRRKRWCGNG